MMAWEGLIAKGPADLSMELLKERETPEEIIMLAYGMEVGLGEFYRAMVRKTEDLEVNGILNKLADIEERHKQRLFDAYVGLHPSMKDKERFESDIDSGIMEGGFTTEEFLEQNQGAFETVEMILNFAMMLEAQAMDLYMRYSQKTKSKQSKDILHDIAEEEKAHLRTLGALLEVRV